MARRSRASQITEWLRACHRDNVDDVRDSVRENKRFGEGDGIVAGYLIQIGPKCRGAPPYHDTYLPIEVAGDLIGNREQDMRYYHLLGTLPWTMSNFWLQYRYSMDDRMLRDKIYPLLRRSINLYLHMLREGDDGKLHLPLRRISCKPVAVVPDFRRLHKTKHYIILKALTRYPRLCCCLAYGQ